MKILAVGRNYAAHAAELENDVPDRPVIFMKPETALLKNGEPFYYPDFSQEIQYEGELVLRISKQGKAIEERFAHHYYDAITVGIDFTARDVQRELKERQVSWELAKAFDGSAAIGAFQSVSDYEDLRDLRFHLNRNEGLIQEGYTKWMLFHFDYLVSFVSQYFTLKAGDLIYTGTPAGVGPVSIGDHLSGYLADKHVLTCPIR
jgi:acylpyruvate hydrolase